jgi:hypothetical protein
LRSFKKGREIKFGCAAAFQRDSLAKQNLVKQNKEDGMAEKVKSLVAIKRYIESGEEARKLTIAELKEFFASLKPGEKIELARQAARELGVELDES